ncbi:anaerobic glycerol-3-phosphate dehydrogenase subunit GlpA [Pseudodesulfovibrio tunisiensis]|uniref:anaerobic glycerol-3-phosphate dehydrogenase subunit GlpA n=1 Tax=Pseudodesulfovibrio tunisiensis TaxID=463192 RepID=UPI001FB49F5D|nr:anaerobic glycerol-3-phosphate dehydrogenase subunit GlpA [Pseudodesulfovibrio tunisiensis]
MAIEARVLIIGGGVTGTGVARDLALRGVPCLLLEKRDINAGASGGNHGLLHSGARYVASDMEAAVECREEGEILRRISPQCIEDTGGLFVAVQGDDEDYVADFPSLCTRSSIPSRKLDPAEVRELEPALSDRVIAAYAVEDAAVDPFMLSLDNLSHSLTLGGSVQRNARVTAVETEGGRIRRVRFVDGNSGAEHVVEPEIVVNAAGAWAGLVAEMAGAHIDLLYSSGCLLVTQDRISRRVVNRLRKASDADILVPGGTVSVLGTTSVTVDHPDHCRPTVEEADRIIEDARAMMPILETTRYIRAYSGVRPLVLSGDAGDARSVSRGFSLIDHARDGLDNFVTITGGKLTTYRLMAERTADMVCAKLGIDAPCRTRTEPVPASAMGMWTEPGRAPRNWVDRRAEDDLVLCECEMVSRSVVDAIIAELGDMRGRSMLKAIGMRSRVGKGPCQGGFCGLRITGHLYDQGHLSGDRGIAELKAFVERRWRGFSPILWGLPLMQADLQEALYCGMLDMELARPEYFESEDGE